MKKLLMAVVALLLAMPQSAYAKALTVNPVVVVIDPGHGGSELGCYVTYQGKKYYEKDLNLKIAKAMRDELKTYSNVKVYMTRTSDKTVSLAKRVKIAKAYKADLFFSIHNNYPGDAQSYTNGSCAITPRGVYHKALASASQLLANITLNNLQANTGLENHGLLLRASAKRKYPNGTKTDYYYVTRMCNSYGIMNTLIEHGFLTDDNDMTKLSNVDRLKAMGVSDAASVASYYGLSKPGQSEVKAQGSRVRFVNRYLMLKDGKYYYVSAKEKLLKGWRMIYGSRYYFTSKGADIGRHKIGRYYYYFYANGKMAKRTYITAKTYRYYYNKLGRCIKIVKRA
jgi:N-acetylmuramoyl-L-alanine amidase